MSVPVRLPAAIAVVTAAAALLLPGTAAANPPCHTSGGGLYCGNATGVALRAAPGPSWPIVDRLDSNPSYFKCWVRGITHSGGNNVWYLTYGDRAGNWGYVEAVSVWTYTDPFPGMDAC
ncbi:hypothetical protein Afil01_20340 [Actinorhabdospora filicis]|uniref:Peptidase inhibitor family I36 n=1 Tax=Actinorhabdospora filicis TaxID=1785913 RepID=A0A9W6W2P0_9ACTN|nr:hypothetical protein [Actinorhabdospora filicis]GLZ77227.1 hypothetical protein Afil01_20340 [Actinorhabdospora filicis]